MVSALSDWGQKQTSDVVFAMAALLLKADIRSPRGQRWEDSPTGWPRWPKGEHNYRTDGRPIAQWSRLKAGYSDDLGTGRR
jgi:hypothetical protein